MEQILENNVVLLEQLQLQSVIVIQEFVKKAILENDALLGNVTLPVSREPSSINY